MSTKPLGPRVDCNRIKELLPDYLDRSLQEAICKELQEHIDACEDCRIYVKTVETTIILYKHCPDRDVPEEVRIDLRTILKARIEEKKSGGESP